MVSTAIEARRTLQQAGFDVGVVSARFVKPLDAELIEELLRSGKPLIITEDHSAIGGLGTAVMQLAASRGWPTNRIVHLAMPADDLVAHASRARQLSVCGLDGRSVVAATARAIDPAWTELRSASLAQATSSSSATAVRVAQ
jgi:1-deoxy-D-xylulose-5-phosphate synthase